VADATRLHLSDVAGVYYQEPYVVQFRPEQNVPLAETLFFSRWRKLVADLAALVPEDAIWLPGRPPLPSQYVQRKVSECAIAARCGLAVPETLCTNDYRQAVAFHHRHGAQVIVRECSMPVGLRIGFFTPTAKARRLLPRTPSVFQRYIPKQYEIRAVAVGRRIVAASIDSQSSEAAKLDWRVMDHARVAWRPTTLPARVQRAMRRFMRSVDLNVASFDMVKSTDGEYYFLEANRPGSFLWLTPLVGIDVAREIAGVLSAHIRKK
jgi:glutathione synthase/RimK-type ligase-like ATP-grasp enzyme